MADILAYNESMNAQDDMEISSEAGQGDVDFEIDFDHIVEEPNIGKEEEMQDDTTVVHEQEDIELRSATDNNDYMFDDTTRDDVLVDQDKPIFAHTDQQAADEELLDLSEEDELILAYQAEDAEGIARSLAVAEEVPVGEIPQPESTFDLKQDTLEKGDETALTEEPVHAVDAEENGETSGEPNKTGATDEEAFVDGLTADEQETSTSVNIDFATNGSHSDSQDQQFQPQFEHDLDENTEHAPEGAKEEVDLAESKESEEPTTLTGLHPTMVTYEGYMYPLFPSSCPSEEEEYFLEDENLVNGSIGNLLQACREVLADGLTDDWELELQVEEFALYISENSTAAFSTSFAEILDVYVQIHRNDGVDPAPAMNAHLVAKPKFANRLTLLANLAAEGKGTAHIPSGHHDMPDYGYEAEQGYTATDAVNDNNGEGDGLFDDKQYAATADDDPDGTADASLNQYTAEDGSTTLDDTVAAGEEVSEDAEGELHDGSDSEANTNPPAPHENHDDTLSALVEDPTPVVAEHAEDIGDGSESDASSKTIGNDNGEGEHVVQAAALGSANPSASLPGPQSKLPPDEEEDELDFDDDYDEQLANNASLMKGTTGVATKRGLDDTGAENDQDTKRLRSSD